MAQTIAMDVSMTTFVAKLNEIETLATARRFLPEENIAFKGLDEMIEHSLISLGQQYINNIGSDHSLRTERPRLVTLYGSLNDVPRAKGILKMILESEIERKNQVEDGQPHGSAYSLCHRILLDIWGHLQSEAFNKEAVEIVVLTGLFSEPSPAEPGTTPPSSVTITGGPSEARSPGSREGEEGKSHLWSIPITCIESPYLKFSNMCLEIVHEATKSEILLYVQKKHPEKGAPIGICDINNIRTVRYSMSKLYIVLVHNNAKERCIRIWMHTLKEAEMIVQKLKELHLFIGVENLDDINQQQEDGPSGRKRKHDDSEDQGSPARTAKLRNRDRISYRLDDWYPDLRYLA
ncbi:MAG: hypothetical protein Q9216_005080 [Gyalolechia sp. 2 TL-2023]